MWNGVQAATLSSADVSPVFFDGSEHILEPTPIQDLMPITLPAMTLPNETNTQNSVEQRINQAVVAQDWVILEPLLMEYRSQAGYDENLYRYALGILRRSQFRHDEAIELYREFLASRPELAYPRFDLGIMLFENHQYREAEQELNRAKPQLTPEMQQVAQQYLDRLAKIQQWQVDFGANYEQSDNVNNASDETSIMVGGLRFVKNEDSLPQSAHGIRYQLGANRDWNVAGNHFVGVGAGVDGVQYWDNSEYSEHTARLQAAYHYRTVRQTVGVVPFVEQNWLGGARYSQNIGANLEYAYRFNPQWRISSAYTHLQKQYHDDLLAQRYDGYLNSVSLALAWQPAPTWVLFGGVDASVDNVKDKAESSTRQGIRIGMNYGNAQWGGQWNVRYGTRHFDAMHWLTRTTRRDSEYQLGASVWHNRLTWKGFTPKLNYRYTKIDSNIPALYSRHNSTWFMSVDKAF